MPKILYLITEDWFFASHFLPMGRAARDAGYDVVVAARVSRDRGNSAAERIGAEGFRLVALDIVRGSLGLFGGLREMLQTLRIVRAERPDIVHCIALRPVVLGGIAAKLAGARTLVLAPTGLGWLWVERGPLIGLLRAIVRKVIGSWLRSPRTHYLFENHDDPLEFHLAADDAQVTIVGGAGVDPQDYPSLPQPSTLPVRCAVVARMIAPKGIAEAVAAVQRARALGAQIELDLFGDPDPANPRSIALATLRAWSAQPGIRWHGRTNDVVQVWRDHHVALLLSYYREGTPRTLVEAAAAGRPIVTTDTPGCRELVRDGQEGLLVAPHDIEGAARALLRLAAEPALRSRMGAAARAKFQAQYTEAAVKTAVTAVYRSLAGPE